MYSLPPYIRNVFNQITEKTIEINCMSEFVKLFSPYYTVTILGPTRRQERWLGFDDILAGLPPGRTFALQFKKPFLRGRHTYPKFTLNVSQLQVLLGRFGRREAFFVLSPFIMTRNFLTAHQSGNLLHQCTLVDVHDIPFPTKQTQGTRTMRLTRHGQVEVTDPWEYHSVKRKWSFDELASSVMEDQVGRKEPPENKKLPKEEKKRYGGPNYYVHVAPRRD